LFGFLYDIVAEGLPHHSTSEPGSAEGGASGFAQALGLDLALVECLGRALGPEGTRPKGGGRPAEVKLSLVGKDREEIKVTKKFALDKYLFSGYPAPGDTPPL
jgi:hypothetical protein